MVSKKYLVITKVLQKTYSSRCFNEIQKIKKEDVNYLREGKKKLQIKYIKKYKIIL